MVAAPTGRPRPWQRMRTLRSMPARSTSRAGARSWRALSMRLALPPSLAKLRDGGDVVALVKPQFEAGRDAVGKGGVVRDPQARASAAVSVANDLASRGFGVVAVTPSPIPGREGNREIFVHARKGAPTLDAPSLAAAAREASG